MATNIEKIRERVDIVELISSYLKLQKSGVNYKANCPFHGEKTPSFYVSPERQIWHCFGCGLGGSIFDFVMHIDGLEFGEAMRLLARRAGVELEQFDQAVQGEKGRLLEIVDWSSKFFQKQLWESNAGLKALAYLKERGLSEESIKHWQLGFAPESWDSLGSFLQAKRYRASEIFNSGLSVKRERGDGYYDRFRSRIVFPVVDLNNQAVGFSGRIFRPAAEVALAFGKQGQSSEGTSGGLQPEDNIGHRDAKYINTPQTLIYDKSRVLYGLNQAKVGLRTTDKCLVVEGNMDVIMSHQAGATHAVASSGTALTDQHLKIIKRYTNNLDFCFDMDVAGTLATERAITAAIRQGFNLGVVMLNDPNCKDPADYVKQHGSGWAEYAKQSQPIFTFYLESGLRAHDPTSVIGKKLIADKVLAMLKHISNKVELAHWLGELALRLGVKEDILREQMASLSATTEQTDGSAKLNLQVLAKLGTNTLEDYLVSLLLIRPELVESVESETGQEFYSANTMALLELFRNYLKMHNATTAGEQANLLDYLTHHLESVPGVEAMYLETIYIQAQETWQDFSPEDLAKEFKTVLYFLNKRVVTAQLTELEMKIKQAEHRGEKTIVTELIKNFQTLSNQLIKLKS